MCLNSAATFFFFNYEGARIRTSRTVLATVPTELERNGDFSQSLLAGQPVQIFDPLTIDPVTGQRQAFHGNRIPADRIDPVGARLVALYPLPNRPGFVNNYLSNPLHHEDADQFNVRIDHTIGPRDSIYGRFSYSNQQTQAGVGGALPAPAWGGGTGPMGFSNRPRSGVVNYSRIFGLYAQHDFRATSELTLNLGVRYDTLSPWWEAVDRDNRTG